MTTRAPQISPRILATLAALFVTAGTAMGHQFPVGCSVNDLDADISVPAGSTQVMCGTTVPFTTIVGNGTTPGACLITGAPVTFTCPNPATGTPTGPTTVLTPSQDFPAGPPPSSTTYPVVGCVIGDTSMGTCTCGGGGVYQAQAQAGPGILHINNSDRDIAVVIKQISVQCMSGELPRHYTCYETRPQSFPRRVVGLVDQFGPGTATVETPERICTPTNKNDEDPMAPADPNHLVAYRMRNQDTPGVPRENLRIENQFGTVHVDITRLRRLMVPASKSLVGPAGPPPAAGAIDHYACYAIRRTRGFSTIRDVQLEDQFESKIVDLGEPLVLCAPVDKNGETPGAETHTGHLLCYDMKIKGRFEITDIFTNDQFGPLQLDAIRRDELCVPSLKFLN